MEEYQKDLIKIGIHLILLGFVALFIYETYILLKPIQFSKGYIVIAIIAIILILYYNYRIHMYISDKLREYDWRTGWQPSPEMLKRFELIRENLGKEYIPITKPKPQTTIEPITERVGINIKINPDKGLFYGKDLDVSEKQYLLSHNYEKGNFVPIGKTRQEEFYVKKNGIESLAHSFLVQNIKQEILRYTTDVKINLSQEPDIIFKNNKEEIVALEVETGTGLGKHRFEIENKFLVAKKRYKKNLYIILTDSRLKYKYKKIFKNIKILTRQEIPRLLSAQLNRLGRHSIPAKPNADTGRKSAEN